jgi:hypothetical protein
MKLRDQIAKELHEECHSMVQDVLDRTKKAGTTVQDVTNVFLIMKLADIEVRLRALEDGKKDIQISDIKF